MNRGVIGYLILLIIVVIVTYIYTGFRLPTLGRSAILTTTTVPANIPKNTIVTTTANYSNYLLPCNNFEIPSQSQNSTISGNCSWQGGNLGIWLGSGSFSSARIIVASKNNVTLMNRSTSFKCLVFIDNMSLPSQILRITLKTGSGAYNTSSSCSYAVAKLNTTVIPPPTVYTNVYNGNFSNGKYTGWNYTGKGFGTQPLNITYADSRNCYLGYPWSNYNGIYFATTYNCGLSNSPGNLTSSPFLVSAATPFLNFKIISPADNQLYVEILENNTPEIIAHYNTFNISSGGNAQSVFQNVSIPLTMFIGKSVRIRIVAQTLHLQKFIAAGDFSLGHYPISTPGILVNMTILQAQ
ncbi:MAG: hypothetical protein ACP5MX_03345 [Candidatus Micrarchaeia archaeon]